MPTKPMTRPISARLVGFSRNSRKPRQAAISGIIADSTPTTPDATVRCPIVPTPAPSARISVPTRNADTNCRKLGGRAPLQSAQVVSTAPATPPRTVMISSGEKELSAALVPAGDEPKQIKVVAKANTTMPQLDALRSRPGTPVASFAIVGEGIGEEPVRVGIGGKSHRSQ